MTRPPVFHRREPAQLRLKRERFEEWVNWFGPVMLVAVVIVLIVALTRCAPAHTAADERDENLCYARLQLAHQARVAEQCNTETFAECPEHDRLMAQFDKEADQCQRP